MNLEVTQSTLQRPLGIPTEPIGGKALRILYFLHFSERQEELNCLQKEEHRIAQLCLMILLASREAPMIPIRQTLFPNCSMNVFFFINFFLNFSFLIFFLLYSLIFLIHLFSTITALMSLTLYMSDGQERFNSQRGALFHGLSSLLLARGHTSNKGVILFSCGFIGLHYWKTIFVYSGLTCFNFFLDLRFTKCRCI